MGYTVHIPLTAKEKKLIDSFLHDLRVTEFLSNEQDLSSDKVNGWSPYVSWPTTDPDFVNRYKRMVGISYGDHDWAHTAVRWLANKLNKSFYWYDNEEKIQMEGASIVRNTWPSRDFKDHAFMQRRMESLVARLDELWERFVSEQ